MWFSWKRVAVVLLLAWLQCCTAWEPQAPEGETVIEGVVFRGEGKVQHLNDKNPNTVYTPPASNFPFFYADLGAMYEVSTIQMLANNRGPNGINAPFQIASWDTFINPCNPSQVYDILWKMCTYNATFTEKGQWLNIKCPKAAAIGQYFRFFRGSPLNNETVPGPYIAEIRFYGKKYRDTYQVPEPDDGPDLEIRDLKIRKEILTGLENLWVEQAWVEFKMNPEYDDVALSWHHDRINAMAVQRSNGRIITVLGTQWLTKLEQEEGYGQFKTNLIAWLSNGAMKDDARFIHADKTFQAGDILVAMRNQTFDLQLVKNAVLSGANPLIVGYVGNKNRPSDSATELLKELQVIVIDNDAYYMPRDIPISAVIESAKYVPLIQTLKVHAESWKMMRTLQVNVDYTVIKNDYINEIKSSRFQKLLKELLDKYYPYFRDRSPCTANPHKRDDRTKIAWYNYNVYTMAQKSEKAVILPGVEIFPGLVADTETATNHRVTINAPKAAFYYPTGVYVNAGQRFKWKVVSSSHDINDYYFTIGCHKDNLYNLLEWKRWPRYTHLHQLSAEDSYTSPVGGVLFVRVTGHDHNITLELENVYRHPWFDLRNQATVDDWENERKRYNGVPYMAYVGDMMHACLPVKEVVKLNKEDQEWVVTLWDNVVKMQHNFRGSRFEDDGFQVFATDVQLSAGWGHAGIPIMGHLPWSCSYVNIEWVRTNYPNGLVHEIGHNLQNFAATFINGGEVSNNVYHFPVKAHLLNFTAYAFNVKWSFSKEDMNEVIKVWQGTEYKGVNLGYYNWLGIIFGEGLLANLFNASFNNRHNLKSEEDKVNFWLAQICQETEFNVLPWQELWHFTIRNETREQCERHPCFFPDDELTQRVPEIVKRQLEKQKHGCVRRTTKKVKGRLDLLRGLNTIRPQFIFFR